jgi:hypothetical protein
MNRTLPSAAGLELEPEASAPEVRVMGHEGFNLRSEAIYVALAAAEVSWVAPLWISLTLVTSLHPPVLVWLGMVVLLLGYSYFYRALSQANLSSLVQQGILVVALVVSIGLMLRYHVYAGAGLEGADWLLEPFRRFADVKNAIPDEWVAIMTVIYFWTRGIMLARRSLSADSVGFSFRAGIAIFVWFAMVITLMTGQDASVFVVSFFFFSLIAMALARIEEVSQMRGSSLPRFGGFWLGWTVGAVVLLTLVGASLATLMYRGGLQRVFFPFVLLLEVIVVGVALLLFALAEWIFTGLNLDSSGIFEAMRGVMQQFREALERLTPPASTGNGAGTAPPLVGVVKAVTTAAIPILVIAIVVLFTWWRVRRARLRGEDDLRESLLSIKTLGDDLKALLQAGRDRLGGLADMVDRYGLGSRLLRALSIRRIYASLLRLAAEAGYPRGKAQTPYEYLGTLDEALPGSEEEVRIITEAYVNAHYGEVPDTREELQRIRDCWQRVRERASEKQA